MINRNGPGGFLYGILLFAFLFLCSPLLSEANHPNATLLEEDYSQIIAERSGDVMKTTGDKALYEGNLRIYVVEPVSSWKGLDGKNWYNGFLAFALDTNLTMDYQENFTASFDWTPISGLPALNESNIKVIAVMTNKMQGYPRNSDPYEGTRPFTAYFTDACAAALPGDTGYNSMDGGYTHTVFVEEVASPT